MKTPWECGRIVYTRRVDGRTSRLGWQGEAEWETHRHFRRNACPTTQMMFTDSHDAFFTRLGEILVADGFRRVGTEAFRRPWAGGFDSIVPMTKDAGLAIKLDFSLDIRHDAVEDLIAEADPSLGERRSESVTSITRLGELRGVGDFFYRPASPSELERALTDFAIFMHEAGRTHFQTLHDPLAMEQAFNAVPGEPCPHCRNEIRRVLRGLTLAGLYRPSALERLIEEYRRHYVNAWDLKRLVPRFDALVAILRGGVQSRLAGRQDENHG